MFEKREIMIDILKCFLPSIYYVYDVIGDFNLIFFSFNFQGIFIFSTFSQNRNAVNFRLKTFCPLLAHEIIFKRGSIESNLCIIYVPVTCDKEGFSD